MEDFNDDDNDEIDKCRQFVCNYRSKFIFWSCCPLCTELLNNFKVTVEDAFIERSY